ncbi:endonuclease VIII [Edwardsiella piscicida]|uniref:Endonuclease 8 n=3 Tax=Edwardsiella TaxID=635 RepID=A0A0H3DWU7_EDWTF|nr:endonuclease VIII [Edwardsiella piscicida]ACY85425.1 endonuclease VIII [Edwardsiella tarda EIB202]ADM42434.1 Endonuclease VIII [Edwardsiella tarda FL6-60]EKS7766471.1 endonuclease VIII [Edwardsiella piscicida]EKS7812876.1 endonuclease VIII [Edwardsiella piscicida]ELM3735887.1 endonuclease VIII [Edwardsiella piscicida]
MPEGPEIRRAADGLRAAVGGGTLTRVWFGAPSLQRYAAGLVGCQITAIETRGKALLIHFSNGMSMYSHNQLYGVWRVAAAGETPPTSRSLRVRLETAERAILLYSASDIQLAPRAQILRHPFLLRIGPDVLDPALTEAQVRERLCSPAFCRRQLGALLLDQRFLAGLGNYLRVEILWQAGVSPQRRATELSPAQLTSLCHALLALPRLSYATRGQVDEGRHHGALFRFRVFHRAGEACERCGTTLVRAQAASRPFYGCPRCQEGLDAGETGGSDSRRGGD